MSTQTRSRSPVRIVVFRDENESKAFEISPNWVYWLGGAVSFLAIVASASLIFGTAMWARSSASQPARLQELEVQIADLKSQLEAVRNAPAPAPAAQVIAAVKPPAVEPIAIQPVVNPVAPPAPVAATAPAAPVAPVVPEITYGTGPLSMVKITVKAQEKPLEVAARAIPESLLASVPQRKTLRISVTKSRFSVRNQQVTFSFALQYSAKDGGNQQGRIVVMAREPSKLASYPDASIAKEFEAGANIGWEKGEYFSVSRFRAVQGKISISSNTLQGLEIMLFDTDGNLIYYDAPKTDRPRESEDDNE